MSRTKDDFRRLPAGFRQSPGYLATSPDVFCQYVPPIERRFQPGQGRLLITVGVGKSRDALRVTEPAMRTYAAQVGADFLALTNRTQTWPLAEKFRVGHFAAQYARTLYVDADVFIRPGAPDIFAAVPEQSIAMHNDFQAGDEMPEWLRREQKLLRESQGVDIPPGCWNSGVMVCDQADAGIWDAPPKPFAVSHCMEQGWIQRAVLATGRLHSLDPRWNWQFWIHPDFANVDEAFFVHVSGLHWKREFLLPLLRALALR